MNLKTNVIIDYTFEYIMPHAIKLLIMSQSSVIYIF